MDLHKIKCFLLDLDGTVYLGDRVIDGAMEAIDRMRKSAKVRFLTNNSSLSRTDYTKKLNKMGIKCKEEEVITSGNVAEELLKSEYKDKKIYLFGSESLKNEFLREGIDLTEDDPDLLVMGLCTDFDFARLEKFCNFVFKGVPYIATHSDVTCPTKTGFMPDVGSFIALVSTATGVSPAAICGKPYEIMANAVEKIVGLPKNKIAMVGDRMYTDMRFGKNNGIVSVLVLTGETTTENIKKYDFIPDVTLNSIADWDK